MKRLRLRKIDLLIDAYIIGNSGSTIIKSS